jgi:hypothetical protein
MPKPVVLCPWKRDARERRLAELRALETGASAEEPVLSSDEVDIHLNVYPKIGRDWMLRGEQHRIVTPGKNEKLYLAGALDVHTGELHTADAAAMARSSGISGRVRSERVAGSGRNTRALADIFFVSRSRSDLRTENP